VLGLAQLAGEQVALGGVGGLAFFDLGGHLLAGPLGRGLRELDAPVEVFDLGFEVVRREVGLPAGAKGVALPAP